MSATNHTPNYSLPQFIGTDVPTWLVDVNGAFSDIDTAIKNAANAAGTVAGDVTALENRVGTVENGLTATNQSLGTLNTTVQQQGGSIAANTTKIGTAALQTDAQNLSGAVNEVNSKFEEQLLWQNNDLSVPFTPQTIALDLAQYREFFIVYQADSTTEVVVVVPTKGVRIGSSFWSRTALLRRDVTITDTGAAFTEGYSTGDVNTSVVNNNAYKPYQIYGRR